MTVRLGRDWKEGWVFGVSCMGLGEARNAWSDARFSYHIFDEGSWAYMC